MYLIFPQLFGQLSRLRSLPLQFRAHPRELGAELLSLRLQLLHLVQDLGLLLRLGLGQDGDEHAVLLLHLPEGVEGVVALPLQLGDLGVLQLQRDLQVRRRRRLGRVAAAAVRHVGQ